MIDPFFRNRPIVSDKVYVEFGESFITGGETIGWVKSINDDLIVLVDADGEITEQFHPWNAVHIEVMS